MFQDVMNADEYSAQGPDGNMGARFCLIYCKFTIIPNNFFAYSREFDTSRIQHSREICANMEFI